MSPRRRTALAASVAVGVAITFWAPSLIASHYADGPGGTEHLLGHPVRGWQFVSDAVRSSRGARLGSHQSALEVARDQVWTGSSGRAVDVRLVWTRNPMRLDGTVVRPESAFSWIVEGRVRRGPRQIIGVLDYRSGQVVWDVRPRSGGPR